MNSITKRKVVTEGNKNMSDSNIIFSYIKSSYELGQPIFMNELYDAFPKIKRGSIRQILSRLVKQKKIDRAKQGVYYLPK